ncbi:conserved hypothetical protein [Desulforapulum autotrophicum HRM2]|uniref:DUF91 domain-containing protein n=1 Tax=Desulforapulum autotrophicum (strain ATCC 43914 / DSM 3382 / VKM B-1955 / HRM2) TaxID=177437 RepID=C0QBM7_DESAH|nr:endonuclease NucS domain-containing protein [Desulforapulum autotrophicum]ACN17029.1 conserved hypothetical protein [Desulforapulum autotrophicum HRM2]
MSPMYDKPVRILMQDMIPALGIKPGDTFSRDQAIAWFAANYPKIKKGTVTAHLMRLSTNVASRHQYSPRADGSDDVFFKMDTRTFRLYEQGSDPVPLTTGVTDQYQEDIEDTEPENTGEFAYERDLRDFLARNLHLIEPGLSLYADEGMSGIEFPAGGRFIDLLALDGNGDFVVIELKVSKGYDRVIGQLLCYVNWIRQNLADPEQRVRGFIIAKSISEDLRLATSSLAEVSLFEYELSVSITPVEASAR